MQAKLMVGRVDDPLEREAERVADQMVSRECATCGKEGEAVAGVVQPTPAGPQAAAGAAAPAAVHDAVSAPGRPLDAASLDFFEPRMGVDLSRVRLHTDAHAAESASEINAQAYTVGSDIVFASGRYRPASEPGRRLLAHELAHVVQQSGAAPSVSRQPGGPDQGAAPVVKAMEPAAAIAVIKAYLPRATDTSQAALAAVADVLGMPRTTENAGQRLRLLMAAFSLLDSTDAGMLHDALTHPANDKQKLLHDRFGALDHRFRLPLLQILAERAAAKPPATPGTDKRESAAAPSQARWTKLNEGVFAYLADAGRTVEQVAQHMSGDRGLAAVLARLNGIDRSAPLTAPRQIIVPVEYISRPEALAEVPTALQRDIVEAQRLHADTQAFQRFAQVKSGHPAGPGAVGVAPLTMAPITYSGVLDAVKYAAGFLVGLLEGAYDAVTDLVKGAWETIKAVAETIYNLVTGQFGKIWAMLTGWVAQLKLLWANRAQIASDFSEKWNARDLWDRGKFQGNVLGWVMTTVLITILTLGEGAIEQIAGKWASIVKVLKLAQKAGDFGTYAKAFTGTAGKLATRALEAIRAKRVGKVAGVVETLARPIVWTATTMKAALKLPGQLADQVTDAIAERLAPLAGYADRIKNLSARAKQWIFGCTSPCRWDPEFARRALEEGGDIEARAERALASEERAARQTVTRTEPAPKAAGHEAGATASHEAPSQTEARAQAAKRLEAHKLELQGQLDDKRDRLANIYQEIEEVGQRSRGSLTDVERAEISREKAALAREAQQAAEDKSKLLKRLDELELSPYDRARAYSYSDRAGNAVVKRATVVDPATKSITVVDEYSGRAVKELSIDHIVPVEEIALMDGFERLSPEDWRAVLSREDNLRVMEKALNSSKGSRPWSKWKAGRQFYTEKAYNDSVELERELRQKIKKDIQDRLAKRSL